MSALTGAKPLFRVAIGQDRRNIAPWVMLISVLSATSIIAYRWIFTDLSDRQALSLTLAANPALELVFGPARDLLTNDGFNAWRAGMLGCFFAALMATLTVVRNSRADEDSGQAELIASGIITRQARLAVAVGMAMVAGVALGVVSFLLTWAFGGGLTSTLLISAMFTSSAWMFAAVAALCVQLGSDARAASSLAIGTLGFTYVLRGWFDSSEAPGWTEWLTPFGWLSRTRAAVDNDPLPLLAALGFTVVLLAVAMRLQARRDFGMGLVSSRPGPATAPRLGVWSLAWRLNRGSALTWLLSFAFLGMVFGNIAPTASRLITENPAIRVIMASGARTQAELTFGFVATIQQVIGIIAAVAGAQVAMRFREEEVDFRAEPLLAAPLRRAKHLAATVLVALGISGVGMVTAGLVMAVVASRGSDQLAFGDVWLQAVCTTVAVWLLVSVSLMLVAAKPVVRFGGWIVIVATFGITLLGPTFKFPEWALDISPLHHVPVVVAPDRAWGELGWLGLVTVGLLAIAFVGYRRRDVI